MRILIKFYSQFVHKIFPSRSQQDSQEFLRFLLEGLHDDLNIAREKVKGQYPDESKLRLVVVIIKPISIFQKEKKLHFSYSSFVSTSIYLLKRRKQCFKNSAKW